MSKPVAHYSASYKAGDLLFVSGQVGISEGSLADGVAAQTTQALANAEKIGYKTGLFVNHPFIKNKKIPVYFANFVLMDYGFGAVFGCPAHDQRDLDFATEYNIDVIPVVKPNDIDEDNFKICLLYTSDAADE